LISLSSAVVVRSWSVVSLQPTWLSGTCQSAFSECHVQNSSRDRMIGALSLHFACLRRRLRSSYERRRDQIRQPRQWMCLDAAAKHPQPRRATRVLHRAPAVLDAGLRRANAVDLVSQGRPRPRSARCGRLVEPAVLAASELVGDAPCAERIEPSRAEQPGRTHARASLEFQAIMRPWRTTTPCSS
jgi:hypothetical protein